MMSIDLHILDSKGTKPKSKCVVRLKTSYWNDNRGVHQKKSLTFMRRHSVGFNILEEDLMTLGVTEVMGSIENLNDVEDGLYEVVTTNISREWETGHIDDYDYRLIPLL